MLGLAAISLPILFHLIRRTPRGRQAFSSLMFLSPSPPRLTRRSRIEQWLLLLLRACALILLALAFARPFLRQAANLSFEGIRGRRVAIVLDTSASMQRNGLWQQAIAKVEHTLSELDPADEVALFTFDSVFRVEVDFEDEPNPHRTGRAELIRERLAAVAPTWAHTDLGSALASVADSLSVESDKQQTTAVLQIIVISDMQQGSQLKALQAHEWPEEIRVAIETVQPTDPTNATLRVLATDEEDDDDALRVRIANAEDSERDQFHVGWVNAEADAEQIAIYVPAGQSRVVRIAPPDGDSNQLVLRGDAESFDNAFFVVPLVQEEVELLYVGSDKRDDPDGLLYYLGIAFGETSQRTVDIVTQTPDAFLVAEGHNPRLIVVGSAVTADGFQQLDQYLRQGGLVLAVTSNAESAVALANYSEPLQFVPSEAGTREDDYLMLADIDFGHPLFATFANPRYSDFTKIHFWNHQRFQFEDSESLHVLARFDNGDPALWEHTIGKGKLLVLASGWHPDDSQLALSTKFVPLVNTLLDQAAGNPIEMPAFTVNDPIPLPSQDVSGDTSVVNPAGAEFQVASSSDWFRQADRPGIYSAKRDGRGFHFAVNLAASESDTTMMDVEQLEQLGVQLGEHATREEESDRERQLRDVELESKQKVWQWLIMAVLGLLGMETWLAGRKSRNIMQHDGDDR
jgi:hypothetical protein